VADRGDGTYRNPVLFADYSDPDVVRHGDDFYMVASSFNCLPGLPVLHSGDLVVMGHDYAYVSVRSTEDGVQLHQCTVTDAGTTPSFEEVAGAPMAGASVTLRVSVSEGALCQFSYAEDGRIFAPLGRQFRARQGHWIGAKVGLFCIAPARESRGGFVDAAWFRVDGVEPAEG